jgi:beta-N-acetylhexosaminidase
LKEAAPLGVILFTRNCETPDQIRKLVASVHDALGREAPILIDQEGGRVQRLKTPQWTQRESARAIASHFTHDFARGKQKLEQHISAIAADLRDLGIQVNCAPVFDVSFPDTHDAIGDRAFSSDPNIVSVMASESCNYFINSGIIPVAKHIPGHGRAAQDSHETLPFVDASLEDMKKTDFLPYKELLSKTYSEAVWGMVAHVVYRAFDDMAAASCSRKIIQDVIRREIGFSGLLLSDDVCMNALSVYGEAQYRVEKCLRSGCDIALHCNGSLDEMIKVAERCPPMTEKAAERFNKSVAYIRRNARPASAKA